MVAESIMPIYVNEKIYARNSKYDAIFFLLLSDLNIKFCYLTCRHILQTVRAEKNSNNYGVI